jgi:DNA-binding NarL/FixJ family response regulator
VGLRTIFKNTDIRIVNEASSSEELLSQIKLEKPDIILIDYTSVGFSIDTVVRVLDVHEDIKVVAISPEQSAAVISRAIQSGVHSHIKKNCDFQEIIDSITETMEGNRFFCGQILEIIQAEGIDVNGLKNSKFSCDPIILSEREIEVITLISEGYTNAQISEKLFLSKHTVNTHRKNIMNKLGVKNTAGIVMYAIRENFTSPNKYFFSGESESRD